MKEREVACIKEEEIEAKGFCSWVVALEKLETRV